jgi:hypothetical protein
VTAVFFVVWGANLKKRKRKGEEKEGKRGEKEGRKEERLSS